MALQFNVNSQEVFNNNFGDVMSLNEFIHFCEDESFIDYDGYVSEVLLNKKVICIQTIYPSELLNKYKKDLLKLQGMVGDLQVVWYNR
ncbi:hypothetical protein [Brevibacillus sp. NRS-1366]|uniref:hypothetical protein n=1 Tax=Brevibacillus sp. NRS-1366 TaxID=3233899 RepID=UPI003D190EDF